ncbi:hypothetical protein AFM11_05180 [Mycolicibacterium wolinskyi]|uniref:Uncharacterized protein n=1 Tax=Mycolicibacterium wolinskyi TaxID=59750 RepID=A0A132PUK4_9MYCO|nr:hypothetical protein AFM11_05180 [Mycolicibacterium wolinskyi]
MIPNNTPAGRAAQRPEPVRAYSQPEIRRRRRAGLPIVNYGGGWSIVAEIAEVCEPLAQRIAASERPGRFSWRGSQVGVHDLVAAAHEAVGDITGWLAEADAHVKTKHLAGDPGKRRYAMTTLCDLAPRPALPDVTDAMIRDGSWAAALIEMAEPVDAGLADLLRRAHPPGAPALRGQLSRSERLDRLLRESLDRPAAELECRLDRADREAAKPSALAKAEAARAELEAMGVEV